MIDIHSHILPQMDDGSQSVQESLVLLDMLFAQGVKAVVATPHFLANKESVDGFLHRREEAYSKLKGGLSPATPKILFGAEVAYYPGIKNLENLDKLKISGSDLLLLEMPFSKWSKQAFKELIELATTKENMTILLAHIERYMDFVSEEQWDILRNYGILFQVNASFFLKWKTKRKAIQMLKRNQIHVIGSDCHNIKFRPPKMDLALHVIEKKLDPNAILNLEQNINTHFHDVKVPSSL